MLGERNGRSLRSILMPSTLPSVMETNNPGVHKCDAKTCIICKEHLITDSHFTSQNNKTRYTIRHNLTCTSTNIIYLLYCNKCNNSQYVGVTKNSLKTRFYQHRSNINKNTGTLVTKHFNSVNHSLLNLKCLPIEKLFCYNNDARLRRETFWINKLETLTPNGLNTLE